MNEEFGKIRIKFSWTCLILITVINISCSLWANYKSYNCKMQLSQIQQEIKTNNSTDEALSKDNPLNQLRPILNAGKVAPYALEIFIIGIFSALFSSMLLILPKFLLKCIKESFMWYDELEIFNKSYKIFIVLNIIILAFEFYGLTTWFDYASTIAKAINS
ncbi:hypothetical protein [Fervidicella metallireducens]|nr:hypothetical protein [Fervidicella metallireducens]